MSFDDWFNEHGIVALPDSVSGEQVWQAAKRDVWGEVFQIVSDNPHMATRVFIRKLESARGEDGCGPES